jgi:hypothetical protein
LSLLSACNDFEIKTKEIREFLGRYRTVAKICDGTFLSVGDEPEPDRACKTAWCIRPQPLDIDLRHECVNREAFGFSSILERIPEERL